MARFKFCDATSVIQVEVLRNFLEQKNKEKTSTEARTKEAEKKLTELNSSLDKVCLLSLVSELNFHRMLVLRSLFQL